MLDFNHKVAGDGRGWSTALPRKREEDLRESPVQRPSLTYTLMKLLRVKTLVEKEGFRCNYHLFREWM